MGAVICDFGKKDNGFNLFRINGDIKQIEKAIKDIETIGCEVLRPYEIEKVRGFEFTTLLYIQIPERVVEEEKKLYGR